MLPLSRRWCPLALILVLAGCGQPTREDRTIVFSDDGQQAVFQHGREGIFLVDTPGAAPRKVFQPAGDVIAVSTPQWSPTDRRLLFTTATPIVPDKGQAPPRPQDDPEGAVHFQYPVRYTCWLRPQAGPGESPEPVALFSAECDHPAYVAANLAVRWHPDGKHVLFIEQTQAPKTIPSRDASGQPAPAQQVMAEHGLFEMDLDSKARRKVFPHDAYALVFDWAPDREQLVCITANADPHQQRSGIWIGKPGEKDWWHVPHSAELAQGEMGSLLSALQASRPVWAPDCRSFAFQSSQAKTKTQPARHRVWLAHFDERTVDVLAEREEPFRELHWRPDGEVLGFIAGNDTGTLLLARVADRKVRPHTERPVRHLAGWDAQGRLAYVGAEASAAPEARWVFLFRPEPLARQTLWLEHTGEDRRTTALLSGMQISFPHWSPRGDRLSLWATFRPSYHSWMSWLIEQGARPDDPLRGLTLLSGDPALLIEPDSGRLEWKAVDTHEKNQVGHYYLRHQQYADAWRWYEQDTRAAALPTAPADAVQQLRQGRDAGFFRYYCLHKLGRDSEAARALEQFEQRFAAALPTAAEGTSATLGAAGLQPTRDQLQHWKNLYEAEVFLALDAAEEGEAFFRTALEKAHTPAQRLSHALVLGQLLLLRHKHSEYARLSRETVLPLLLAQWKPMPGNPQSTWTAAQVLAAYGDALGLLPLAAPDFLAGLSTTEVEQLLKQVHALQPRAADEVQKLLLAYLQQAAAQVLSRSAENTAAARRIGASPTRQTLLAALQLPSGSSALSFLQPATKKAK